LNSAEPVVRLLPGPRDPLLLASVRLAGPYRSRPAERDLFAAIRRPTGRGPITGRPVPWDLLPALAEAAALEGASLCQPGQQDVLRILSPGLCRRPAPPAAFGADQQLAVICTGADDRASWLRAGQAMQRVLLLAAHRGLLAAPLGMAPEAPEAPPHGEPALGGGYPVMILRLGYGPPWPATGRRPVAEVLRVVTPAGLGRHRTTPPVTV
jgi:hypothetical protein